MFKSSETLKLIYENYSKRLIDEWHPYSSVIGQLNHAVFLFYPEKYVLKKITGPLFELGKGK